MLNLTYSYRIYPSLDQEAQMLDWLEQSIPSPGRLIVPLPAVFSGVAFSRDPVRQHGDTACGGRWLGNPDEAGNPDREEGKPALYPLG